MVALFLIILMDLIVMALVMYYGTRPDHHAPTLESPSVVSMQAVAQKHQQQLEAQVAKASAEGESKAEDEDAEAKKAAAAARREAALARKAAKQKAENSDG